MRGDGLAPLYTLPLHPSVLEPHFDLMDEAEEPGHFKAGVTPPRIDAQGCQGAAPGIPDPSSACPCHSSKG